MNASAANINDILAWDPDFSKVTAEEDEILRVAEAELDSGEFVNEEDINWKYQ